MRFISLGDVLQNACLCFLFGKVLVIAPSDRSLSQVTRTPPEGGVKVGCGGLVPISMLGGWGVVPRHRRRTLQDPARSKRTILIA